MYLLCMLNQPRVDRARDSPEEGVRRDQYKQNEMSPEPCLEFKTVYKVEGTKKEHDVIEDRVSDP